MIFLQEANFVLALVECRLEFCNKVDCLMTCLTLQRSIHNVLLLGNSLCICGSWECQSMVVTG